MSPSRSRVLVTGAASGLGASLTAGLRERGDDVLATDRSEGVDLGNPAHDLRSEDAFDVEAVAAWLRAHAAPDFREDVEGTPQVRQFPGGASNLTYLLRYPGRELILRRPPTGAKAKSAHDMGREHRIQAALKPVFGLVPAMVGFCDDHTVIGSDFYVMEKVDGTILRRDVPFALSADQASALCGSFLDVLVDLHSVDAASVPGLADLDRGSGYVERQVDGWIDRLERARTDDLGDWAPVTSWIREQRPADVAHRLIHNDFRLDNVVLDPADPTRIVAVLDWEMATVGDPLMDLGGAMSYWIEAGDDDFLQAFRRQPSNVPGMWSRAEIVARYCARMGFDVSPERWLFYELFGTFRLAVIAQQIWYRYFHGQTTNEAYAIFGPAVRALETRCRRMIGA